MKIDIELLEGQQLKAVFGDHYIISDQSKTAGGKEAFPEPFDFFLASLPLCAAFYARKFCEQRKISTDGLTVSQSHVSDSENKYKKHFTLNITLPDGFPAKYEKALLASVNTCTVKNVIQASPEFSVNVIKEE